MDIGTWIQLAIAIAAFVAAGVALYGLRDSSAKFRQQFVQAQTIAQETQYAQYRPILTPFSTLPLHMGELDITVSELPLTLVNVGTGTALNTWGVLVPPKYVPLRPYSFRNQVPLLQENRAEVRFHFGRFLFTEKDKIGAYDLMPSSELTREDGTGRRLRYAARLSLTYLDVFGNKHATIYDLTDENEWKFVADVRVQRDLDDMDKDIKPASGNQTP